MGGKGGGTNTVTNNSAPPPEVMAQYRNIISQANQIAGQPLQQYTGPMIADFSPDQQAAFQSIRDAQGISSPYFGQAQQMFQNSASPIELQQFMPEALNQYMDPYLDQVVDATMANLGETFGQQNQSLVGNAISKGAWGGDRAGVAQAELARQQGLVAGQTIGGLRSQGFNQALNQFNTQQQNQMAADQASRWLSSQGAYGMANLGTQAQQNALQGAGAQLATGEQQQQMSQAALNIPYEQFLQQQAYPYQNLSWLSGISTGLGSGMGGTSTSTQPGPNPISQGIGNAAGLGSLAYLGYLAFSDRRLKDQIREIGSYKDYPLYEFRYKGDDKKNIGVMAQDVEKTNPNAVVENNGYKMVDYSKLARGGSVTPRGIRPQYAPGGIIPAIPNAGVSYIPEGMQLTRGSGLPNSPQPYKPEENTSSNSIGLLSTLMKANKADEDASFNNPLGLSSGSGFDASDIAKLANAFESYGGGFSRGGVPKYAPGGMTPYDADAADAIKYLYADDAPAKPVELTGAPQPQGITPNSAYNPSIYGPMPDISNIAPAKPVYEPDPMLALLSAGTAIGAGQSPFLGVNMAAGAREGIKNLQDQQKQAADESYKQGNLQQEAQKLYDSANEWRQKLYEDANYHDQSLDIAREKNDIDRMKALRGDWKVKQLPNGRWVRVNEDTGEMQAIETPAGVGNMNTSGFTPGEIPQGLSVPVVPENFNTTKDMPPVQAAILKRKYQENIAKDDEAATQAEHVANEFNRYLSVNKDTDSGGLAKIGLIRDLQSAFDSKDATADSINKTLTFNSLGFERTPGMRITQAEFMINREAMPSRGNPPEANRNIANYWIAKMQTPQEWADFKRDYMLANDGDWNEALGKKMFKKYLKDNPIFDPSIMNDPDKAKVENFKLNPNRKTLAEYAASGGWSNMDILGAKAPTGTEVEKEDGIASGSKNETETSNKNEERVNVYDPQGRAGTIPKSKLQGALASGYKER